MYLCLFPVEPVQERSDASLFSDKGPPGEGDVVELMDKENCKLALRKIDHRLDEAWVGSR
jgi:hypothetical protein